MSDVVRLHADDLEDIIKGVREQFLSIPQEFSDLLRLGRWQQNIYGIIDPMQRLWLQIDISERTFSLSFLINEGRLLDRLVFNRPPATPDCTCISPYDKTLGPHHSRNCPRRIP